MLIKAEDHNKNQLTVSGKQIKMSKSLLITRNFFPSHSSHLFMINALSNVIKHKHTYVNARREEETFQLYPTQENTSF